jgi:2-succinyl-6-hydroxy-2,4-cyclohexadiene-1-carboxylate synthase
VTLGVDVRGDGPPLVLLHGFTQTGRLWGPFGEQLARRHTLIALDLPGHADSDAVRADLQTTAGLVRDTVRDVIGTDRCDLLGYSLGARVALHVAMFTDLQPNRLVLFGATGGLEDEAARAQRRQRDEAMADALEASGDVAAFIEQWLRNPMFVGLAEAAQVDERRRNSASGLASSLRLTGTGTQAPLWDRLASVTAPVLALAGTDDVRFGAHALRLTRLVPHGVASLVPGGGHAAHLAQPALSGRLVQQWLTSG